MTPQEQQLLQDLTNKINQTVLQDKDPEAEQYLNQTLGRNPDALYILAQTVLVQNYALDQAKQQLQQSQQQQPAKHTSFLGSLLGTDHAAQPTPPPPPPPQQYQQSQQSQYAPVPNYPPQYAQPQYAQPGYAPPMGMGMGGGSGFLGSALRTAGGVAAGALAFEGIESLMHGFGEHAGYGGGQGFGGMGGGRPEEVVNNYYGDSGGRDGVSNDIEDRRNDNFADSSNSGDYTTNDPDLSDSNADYGTDDSSSGDSGGGDYGTDN